MDIKRESDYFAQQSENFTRITVFLAAIVGVVMGAGALFATINAMYVAISSRTVEIATLRAVGFSPLVVLLSVFSEVLTLASRRRQPGGLPGLAGVQR